MEYLHLSPAPLGGKLIYTLYCLNIIFYNITTQHYIYEEPKYIQSHP